MRTPTQALLNAIGRDDGGVAIVWCPDLGLRAWLVDEVRGLAGDAAAPVEVRTVSEALAAPEHLVLLVPEEERSAVDELEGCRDRFLEPPRTYPVVIFLLRHGDGRQQLARSPSLASWVRGSDVDPEAMAEIDVVAERARFEAEAGEAVEAWLARWQAGEFARTGEAYARAYWATLLETRTTA